MSERRATAKTPAPRKRALVSCDRCKLRRARCIRSGPDEPCADCKVTGHHCESKLPRKQRVYGSIETLSVRYRALESLVKGLFPQDNIQDTNTLFKLAAERDIPMPANDDYTPASIFSDSSQGPLHTPGQSAELRHPTPQPELQAHASLQATPHYTPSRSIVSSTSTSKQNQPNPFSEVQQPPQQVEKLIPTRHGVPHYFGPSSSFRLASTIRTLVARCKAIQGADIPGFQRFDSIRSESVGRISVPLPSTNILPLDEEYPARNLRGLQSPTFGSRKRTRSQLEETDDRWEHTDDDTSPDTIADLLPSRSLADALVSAYFDHVHTYLPLFHRSMFQFKLETTFSQQATLLKDCNDIGWLICLALVFSFGCQQLQEHDPEQAHFLRLKYLGFAKSYFRNLLTTTSLVNVQALVLLNQHHHTVGQKSSSWLLIGLGARMVSKFLKTSNIQRSFNMSRQSRWECTGTVRTWNSIPSSGIPGARSGGPSIPSKRYCVVS
jgi:proline utilization trans-activator